MKVIKEEKEIAVEHPMEDAMDIDPGTTIVPVQQRSTELVKCDEFDDKDKEIEEQLQEVYDAAFDSFEDQQADSKDIEPKFRARNSEVAVQFLNTALQAAKEKASLKQHKDKVALDRNKNKGPRTLNQNLIVADRNELLKHLKLTDNVNHENTETTENEQPSEKAPIEGKAEE